MTVYSRLLGTGSYLPEKKLTNADFEARIDTTDQWIRERTGIEERRIAAPEETASSMAEIAAEKAIKSANIDKNDIDMIIVATTTPDKVFPSTACLLQKRLGIKGSAAFDITAACSGYIYIMSIADQFIRNQTAKTILIVGTELLTKYLDWQDRSTCILFGDGAGAAILQASEQPGILSTHLHADGHYHDLLYVPSLLDKSSSEQSQSYLKMSGNEVFKVAVTTLGKMVDETLVANKMQKEDIDWLIPHQANLRIIKATAKKLNLPMERVIVTVNKHGNTSAASVALALDEGINSGKIKRGETLLLEAFGGGFTWGSVLMKY